MIKLLLFDFFGVIAFSTNPLKLNQELLQFIKVQRNSYQTAILSNSGVLLKNKIVLKGLEGYFDEIYLASGFNLSKSDPEIYKLIAQKFKLKPEEILFIDDQEWRIEAAQTAGCQTILFENNQQLFRALSSQLL